MQLNKVKEVKQVNNDIYILENLSNKFLINNNYEGITILNQDLSKKDEIKLFKDFTIYYTYPNHVTDVILLYCPDNECMVYINPYGKTQIIEIGDRLSEKVFSKYYFWINGGVIVIDSEGVFYQVNISENKIREIDKEKFPIINEYSTLAQKFEKYVHGCFVSRNDDSTFDVYVPNIKYQYSVLINQRAHEMVAFKQYLVQLSEKEIWFSAKGKVETCLKARNHNYIFLRARFINEHLPQLVVLSSNQSDPMENILEIYQVEST